MAHHKQEIETCRVKIQKREGRDSPSSLTVTVDDKCLDGVTDYKIVSNPGCVTTLTLNIEIFDIATIKE